MVGSALVKLSRAIFNYESDTFSATAEKLSQAEAEEMSVYFLDSLVRAVEVGDSSEVLRCDGVGLRNILLDLRESKKHQPTRANTKLPKAVADVLEATDYESPQELLRYLRLKIKTGKAAGRDSSYIAYMLGCSNAQARALLKWEASQ